MLKNIQHSFEILLLAAVLLACNNQPQKQLEIIQNPSGVDATLPFLTKGHQNELILSWVESIDTVTYFFYSVMDKNDSWAKPIKIGSGANWFVNWADYPMVHVPGKNQMISHYLQKSASDTYAYDIMTRSFVNSKWNEPVKLHNDSTNTEHGFVSYASSADRQYVHLFWLDGRHTSGAHQGAMTLRTAIFDKQLNKLEEKELDHRVCDCCQTTAVMTEDGPIVFYRDRSELEIRDIYYTKLVNSNWTTPRPVFEDNWKIEGCPVNGPRAYSLKNTTVIAWYTGANNRPEVKLSFSNDNGETFQKPVVVDNKQPFGRVDVVLKDKNTAIVTWLSKNKEGAAIMVAEVNRNGKINNRITLDENSGARTIGFPQLEKGSDFYYVAYTKMLEDSSIIEIVRLDI